jgi:hypothetical protein
VSPSYFFYPDVSFYLFSFWVFILFIFWGGLGWAGLGDIVTAGPDRLGQLERVDGILAESFHIPGGHVHRQL